MGFHWQCRYEPPNASVVLRDAGDAILKFPQDFQLVGRIKKQKGVENISFWLPQAPPGFVALGCIACRGPPKLSEFSSLRCIRSDMVTSDQFPEESLCEISEPKFTSEPFSIWTIGSEVGTFLVRSGSRKPPKRFALKLAYPITSGRSDDIVIDAKIGTFSAAVFDDYGGLVRTLGQFEHYFFEQQKCIMYLTPECKDSFKFPILFISIMQNVKLIVSVTIKLEFCRWFHCSTFL